jgi:exodeoxyribonuclease-3
MDFRIATWNVNSLRVRLPHVLTWLQENTPDVLMLQETKVTDVEFPKAALLAAGYSVNFSGQKTYNGVAMLSRIGEPTSVTLDFPDFEDTSRRLLAATMGEMHLVNVYVPNGSSVDSEKYAYKLKWLAALERYVAAALKQYAHVVVLGDFNIAPRDEDVHDKDAWAGSVLVSARERAALQKVMDLGMEDAFCLFNQGLPVSFSWWDYRQAAFQRDLGLRIDLILTSEGLSQYCTRCDVDKTPRGLERPSDHAPVIAEFSWT